jgi:hypothetical protein
MKLALVLATVSFGAVALAQQQQPWGQCSGIGYTGPTVCGMRSFSSALRSCANALQVEGWTCQYFNPYFSWCLEPTTTSATASATPV